jgi:hypothetical protein
MPKLTISASVGLQCCVTSSVRWQSSGLDDRSSARVGLQWCGSICPRGMLSGSHVETDTGFTPAGLSSGSILECPKNTFHNRALYTHSCPWCLQCINGICSVSRRAGEHPRCMPLDHTHARFKRAGVGTKATVENGFLLKNEHRTVDCCCYRFVHEKVVRSVRHQIRSMRPVEPTSHVKSFALVFGVSQVGHTCFCGGLRTSTPLPGAPVDTTGEREREREKGGGGGC